MAQIEHLPDQTPGEPAPKKESQTLTSGQWLWKKAKPAGCILILVLMVMALIICFTSGADPIKGYSAPQDTAYYAEHPEELAEELNENVLPNLQGNGVAEAGDGEAVVTVDADKYAVCRSGVLRYFDESIVEFAER